MVQLAALTGRVKLGGILKETGYLNWNAHILIWLKVNFAEFVLMDKTIGGRWPTIKAINSDVIYHKQNVGHTYS